MINQKFRFNKSSTWNDYEKLTAAIENIAITHSEQNPLHLGNNKR